ncbi:hypothetical protein HPB49_015811 [Dermacentor silvarum]|uniref:Uncharacterized protein n=1 Tax=Dermacentor silvarum TaxID=543639 RepID=A0ACB8DJH8_DERSI|nr:hypothetical protein HPB49_015811 [Dermacentor silvarum]
MEARPIQVKRETQRSLPSPSATAAARRTTSLAKTTGSTPAVPLPKEALTRGPNIGTSPHSPSQSRSVGVVRLATRDLGAWRPSTQQGDAISQNFKQEAKRRLRSTTPPNNHTMSDGLPREVQILVHRVKPWCRCRLYPVGVLAKGLGRVSEKNGGELGAHSRCTMRTTVLAVTVFVTIAAVSASRSARQAPYQPGGGAASRGQAAGGYDAYQPQQAQAQSFRPQVQAAPQQAYDQSAYQGQPAPRGRTTVQSFGGGLARPTQQSQSQGGQQSQSEEEEEEKPNPLTLLLEKSTFTCSGKTDGYYADNSVNCQVFHYCVGGAKHSWMCPEGTVFHQVHLNCVPASQDICNSAEKFFFVNDYLHKATPNKAPAADANPSYLYRQGAASNSAQSHQSSVKYDDDY